MSSSGNILKQKIFYLFVNILCHLGTGFFGLIMIQFAVDFSFLKQNFVYFDFFAQITFSTFFFTFYIYRIFNSKFLFVKAFKHNVQIFILSMLFMFKAIYIIQKTNISFIDIQIGVCLSSFSFWILLNVFIQFVEYSILFSLWM